MKFRLTITMDYDVDPKNYQNKEVSAMIASDEKSFSENPEILAEMVSNQQSNVKVTKVEQDNPYAESFRGLKLPLNIAKLVSQQYFNTTGDKAGASVILECGL